MGRIGITYQEVANAATQLQGQQHNPTVDTVRNYLGTGSKSTIARYLKEWKRKLGVNDSDESTIPQELLALVKGLWEHLQSHAEQKIAAHQQTTDQELQVLQQQLQALQQKNQQLQQQLQEEKNAHSLQQQWNQTLQQQLNTEQQVCIKQQERAEQLTQQLTQQKIELDRLHQLLKHIQANLEHYQSATQTLREEQTLILEKQRHAYEQQLRELQQQLSEINIQNAQWQFQCNHLQEKTNTLEEKFKRSQQKVSGLRSEQQIIQIELHTLQSHHQLLNQQICEQSKLLEEKSQLLANTTYTLELAHQHNQQQEQKIRNLRNQLDVLQQN